jgi:hypothetical protein
MLLAKSYPTESVSSAWSWGEHSKELTAEGWQLTSALPAEHPAEHSLLSKKDVDSESVPVSTETTEKVVSLLTP